MAFIPVPNVAQVNVRGTYLNEQVENTLYVRQNVGWTAESLSLMCGAIATWFQASMLPLLSTFYTFREAYAVDLTTVSSGTATASPVSTATGGTAGDPLPGNVALCASFRTGSRGRSFRGRNYVCGLVEPNVTGNNIASTWANSVVNAYEQLLIPDEWLATIQEWVVVSRYANNQPRSSGIATRITDVLVVDTFVDSQRRRLPGRGR